MGNKGTEHLLIEYSLNIKWKKEWFDKVSSSSQFDIYKHKEIKGFEMAIMRGVSEPHFHTKDTFFCFTEDAVLTLGGLDTNGVGHVSDVIAKAHQVYPINAFVLHAARPRLKEVILLIYTPSGDRLRESEYPNDTFKPREIIWEKLA